MNNQNEFKCNLCKRSFKIKAALAQHKRDVHSCVAENPTRGGARSRNARSRGTSRGRGRGTSLALNPTLAPTTAGNTITVSGEDRMEDFEVSVRSTASTVRTFMIDASMSPRLRSLSQAFQRIRFLQVLVNVTAQVSAFTNGGYVAGFIMDPDDAKVTKVMLSASQGSMVRKWYESATIIMPRSSELLYTSSGLEPRTRSPGRFWLMVDQAPSATANVVLTVKWRVSLSHPTYEDLGTDFSFFLQGCQFISSKGNYNLQRADVGSKVNGSDDTKDVYPDAVQAEKENTFFSVPPFNVEYKEGTGDTGTIQCNFIVYSPKDHRTYFSQDGISIDTTPWQTDVTVQVVIPCGAYLRHHNGCQENLKQAGVTSRPSNSQDSPDLSLLLTRITSCLEKLERTSNKSLSSSMSDLEVVHQDQV